MTSWLALDHWNGACSAVSIAARGFRTKAAAPRLLSLSSLSLSKKWSQITKSEREIQWRRNDSNSTKNLVIAFASLFLLPLPPFAPSLCLSISPPKLSSFCSQTLISFFSLSLSLFLKSKFLIHVLLRRWSLNTCIYLVRCSFNLSVIECFFLVRFLSLRICLVAEKWKGNQGNYNQLPSFIPLFFLLFKKKKKRLEFWNLKVGFILCLEIEKSKVLCWGSSAWYDFHF